MQQDHTKTLANLATSTKADREAVSLLTRTISELTSQVTTLTKNIDTANKTIVSLKRNSNHGNNGGIRGGGSEINNRGHNTTDKSDRNIWSRTGRKFDPNEYCFSYGFKEEEGHTCQNYNKKSPGHNATAIRMNTKDGKRWDKGWINGGPTK